MREILFRGKRVDTKEWVYGYFFKGFTGISYILVLHDHILKMTEFYEVITETVCQFTGLLDKHGIKIFEGDIVKATYDYGPAGEIERIVEVVFDPFGTNLQDWIFKEDGYLPEIIGNIHDNPELVEVKYNGTI